MAACMHVCTSYKVFVFFNFTQQTLLFLFCSNTNRPASAKFQQQIKIYCLLLNRNALWEAIKTNLNILTCFAIAGYCCESCLKYLLFVILASMDFLKFTLVLYSKNYLKILLKIIKTNLIFFTVQNF